jgi:pimeloyl-ACP methyl ester carboxylesterase
MSGSQPGKIICLRDGRSLAFAEYGEPGGKPVFFFHGMPGSRFFHPQDEITTRLNVRLICMDRPGYGESTFQPGRSILDWPGDIAQLADQLGIGKFSVTGHSGGGPYVAACAYALPDRIASAAVLSGAGPVDSPDYTLTMSATNKLGMRVGRYIPWLLWQGMVWLVYHRRAHDPAADMARGNGIRPKADDEELRKPEVQETCLCSELEAFRPGLQGTAWDARLLTRPWGFPLEKIRIPVHLWHGTDDDQVPPGTARYIAGKIPGSRITIFENEAHLALFSHWEEILTQLITE